MCKKNNQKHKIELACWESLCSCCCYQILEATVCTTDINLSFPQLATSSDVLRRKIILQSLPPPLIGRGNKNHLENGFLSANQQPLAWAYVLYGHNIKLQRKPGMVFFGFLESRIYKAEIFPKHNNGGEKVWST